jgi:hypothetical protein
MTAACDRKLPRRIGLPKTTHNASQIIPNKIAASTSVKKCAPNAIRLNPTKATSDMALKIDIKRQFALKVIKKPALNDRRKKSPDAGVSK